MMLGMAVAGDLSAAEQRVWDAFPAGRFVDFGPGKAEGGDPEGGEGRGPDRQVRAEVLAALLCGAVEVEPGQVGEVYLARARIAGKLDLPGATFKHRLRLNECYLADGIDLSEASTRTLILQGCHVGAIRLLGAKINGSLNLRGTHLDGKDGPALDMGGLIVTGDIRCNKGFRADGLVDLRGASIGGGLILNGAQLDGKDGPALKASGVTVTTVIQCDEGFRAEGEICLINASVGHELAFSGAHLNGKDGAAIYADGLTVSRDMFCDEVVRADGGVSLYGANIGGELNLSGAHLNGKDGPALDGTGLNLAGAKIGRLLDDEDSWPHQLILDGLTYGDLTYMSAQARLDWLNRSPRYS